MVENNPIRRADHESGEETSPPRGLVVRRCFTGLCPRCGGPGLFHGDASQPDQMRKWGFRLRHECPYCGLRFQEESGVTLGTTVVGYVLVVVFAVCPLLLGFVLGWIPGWFAITFGVALSFILPTLLYPFLLRVTLATWFGYHPDAFDQQNEPEKSPYT